MSWGVDCICSSDPALPWLWYRPVVEAPIQPLAWELPYAAGVVLKKKKIDRCLLSTFYAKGIVLDVVNLNKTLSLPS